MKYKIGQQVYSTEDSGFCQGGWSTVTGLKIKFDENTREKYQLVICGDREFRGDTGDCVKGGSAYYLTGEVKT